MRGDDGDGSTRSRFLNWIKAVIQINIYSSDSEEPHRRRTKLRWTIGPVSQQRLLGLQEIDSMFQLTDTQQVPLSASFVDKKGAPAQVQNPVWASTDPTVVAVTPDANDPTKALVVAGLPGAAQVSLVADADLGDGVTPITGTLDFTVVGGAAASVALTAGTPVEQAPAAV